MFLVSHSMDVRAREIRSWIPKHPSVSLVIAAVYFEWTVCRAIVALGKRPNKEIRKDLEKVHGLAAYKETWRKETQHLQNAKTLPEVVSNWEEIIAAFHSRNVLVHGRDRYTQNMVRSKIDSILRAITNVCDYCQSHGKNLNSRLPQRRQKKQTPKDQKALAS